MKGDSIQSLFMFFIMFMFLNTGIILGLSMLESKDAFVRSIQAPEITATLESKDLNAMRKVMDSLDRNSLKYKVEQNQGSYKMIIVTTP